jgi:hypothetical protein
VNVATSTSIASPQRSSTASARVIGPSAELRRWSRARPQRPSGRREHCPELDLADRCRAIAHTVTARARRLVLSR